MCSRPYDKTVNAIVLAKQDLLELVEEHHPLLLRNVLDEFIEQLTWSRRSAQKLGLEATGRADLWDEQHKRVKAKWDVILQQERRKEDEARLARGNSLTSNDDEVDVNIEAPQLIEAEAGAGVDKFELVQKQVQQQSIVLAQVANSFKESAEKTRDKMSKQNADLKKFQSSVVDALKSHSHRIERIEGAIEGLHRLLVAQMGGMPYNAETGKAPGGSYGLGSDPYLAKAKEDLREGGRAYAGQPRPRGGADDFGVEALNQDVADDDNARMLKFAANASGGGRPGSRSPPPLSGYEASRLRRAL